MTRLPALFFAPLLISAGPSLADINNSGRVLAQLDDMRAIYFVLILVIVLMLALVFFAIRSMMKAQEQTQRTLLGSLTAAVEKLALSLDGMTKAQTEKTTADLVHNAHVEAVMARTDNTMTRIERYLDANEPAPRAKRQGRAKREPGDART